MLFMPQKTDELETTTLCLTCGGPLDVVYDYEMLKNQMNSYLMQTTVPSVLKYLDLVEKGTSPDIIVAAIEAFEKGYNELVYQRRKKR